MSNTLPSLYEKKIEGAAKFLLEKEQADCPVTHTFGNGIYIREVKIPAGSFSIGHYHRYEHLNVLVKGSVILIKEDGTQEVLEAPKTFFMPAGRKVGYILEDMIWLNIYHTNETDLQKIEDLFLDKSKSPWEKEEIKLLEDFSIEEESRKDFLDVIKLLDFTLEQVDEMSRYEADLIPFPNGSYKCIKSASKIHGFGMFATSNIKKDEVICPARIEGKRTPAGRFTNHSVLPNAKIVKNEKEDIFLVALEDISGNTGGSLGSEITIDYYNSFLESR